MKLLNLLNRENVTEDELKNFKHRRAVRSIVVDIERKIALNYSRKHKYYGLPGGGVEKYETWEEGLIRESKEETGCSVEIIKELGIVKEYRKRKELINESYGYIAKVVGEKGELELADDEKDEEIIVEWFDIDEALNLIKTVNNPPGLYDEYQRDRDISFMEEAKKFLG